MLVFQRWKTWTVIIACLAGVFLAAPNLFDRKLVESLPSFLPKHQVSLGLDLQGGSHLLLEVDLASVTKDRLNGDLDSLRTELLKAKIGYTNLTVEADHLVVALRDPADADKLPAVVKGIDADLVLKPGAAGMATISYSEDSLKTRETQTVEQSIEIIRRRIDELGTREPTIAREGSDRILVQLPGIDNPEHVKSVLGRTAKLTFRLVDMTGNVDEAQHGHVPVGDELLPGTEEKDPKPGTGSYLVKRRVMVDGGDLVGAAATFQNNEPVISFKFNSNGARRFGEATAANVGKPFAIVLDNKVISAPNIREAILGGSGIISGSFTVESANDLALLLRAGALPAPLTILEERSVGPDLGADSISAGTTAAIVAVALVAIFMVIFYGLFGVFADIALFFNLALLLAALSVLGATLTLPGIAGIALTMGMAVDANVLVNERIREELRAGRSLISAIDAGFSRAYATIIDANVTHLIAGTFLFELGSGPVKGFAVTLCLGILTSLFTTMMVTRLLVIWWLRRRPKALPRPIWHFLNAPPHIPFSKLHMMGFAISILLTVISCASLATRGLNYGIDFKGGIVMDVKSASGPIELDTMRTKLNGLGLGDVSLQTFGSPDDVLIRLPRQPGGDAVQNKGVETVKDALGSAYDYRSTDVVGPKVGGELIMAGVWATLLATLGIAAYVAFRFEWQFGVGAIISTAHDVITTLGLFSLLGMEFNLTTLAAILTIAGYSINDTVVIYDRVRETLRKYKVMDLPGIVDLSLNETLSRTVLTSSVTALSVLALLLFGGNVIRGFSAAMLWGIAVGTYSSLFIAAPTLLHIRPNRSGQSAPIPAE